MSLHFLIQSQRFLHFAFSHPLICHQWISRKPMSPPLILMYKTSCESAILWIICLPTIVGLAKKLIKVLFRFGHFLPWQGQLSFCAVRSYTKIFHCARLAPLTPCCSRVICTWFSPSEHMELLNFPTLFTSDTTIRLPVANTCRWKCQCFFQVKALKATVCFDTFHFSFYPWYDIVIYKKNVFEYWISTVIEYKYIFGLQSHFWHRDPKTLGIS